MKIVHVKEKPKKKFKPFSLRIETEAEFKFLWGLFNSGSDYEKKDCVGFNDKLDRQFFNVLEEEKDEQNIDVYS